MRSGLYIGLSLLLAFSCAVGAVDDPVVSPGAGITESAPVVPIDKPKPLEKPKPVEKPKTAEKPRAESENTGSVSTPAFSVPAKTVETVAPVSVPAPIPAVSGPASSYSFSCVALAFAMLIVGIGVGFLGRHLMSRHKLGGMTVRIGTWRGIP